MVAFGGNSRRWEQTAAARAQFDQMRPEIELRARHAFRRAGPERIEDLVAEVTAHAFQVFIYLAKQGKANLAHAKPLANSAIRQVRIARRLPQRGRF